MRAALTHVNDGLASSVGRALLATAPTRSEGSGLGLSIVWDNVRLHGGPAQVANHPGGGAVFTVSPPVETAPPMPRQRVSSTGGT